MKYGIKTLMAAGVLVFAVGVQGALAAPASGKAAVNKRKCAGDRFGEGGSGARRHRQRGDKSQH